jgi:hypothetical protein
MSKLVGAILAGAVLAGMTVLPSKFAPTEVWAHQPPQPCDFTTGGGFVFKDPWPTGPRVNFGIVGGCKNEGFYGHVNVVDHTTQPPGHLNGPVTGYFDAGMGYRDLCGTGKLSDGRMVKFRIRTKDNGEPGGFDRFGVEVASIGYLLTTRELGPPGMTGGGGNIQLHKPNPSNTGPAVPPDDFDVCGGTGVAMGF